MCRLFGVISRDPVDAAYYVLKAPQSLEVQSHVDKKRPQGDGWGIGWFAGGQPRISKSPRPLYRDQAQVRKAIKQAKGNVLLGHVRWASNPLKLSRKELIGPTHTQPFSHGKWLFIHNGTLFIPREVKAALGPWAKFVKGQNDSEVLFYWLLRHLLPPLWGKAGMGGDVSRRPLTLTLSHKGSGDLRRAVRQSIKGLHQIWDKCKKQYPIYKNPYHGLNWILTDGKVFLAFCYVNSQGFGKAKALCPGDQPYYELQVKPSDGEVVVASEPMASEPGWRAVRHGQLVTAQRRGRQVIMKTLQVM